MAEKVCEFGRNVGTMEGDFLTECKNAAVKILQTVHRPEDLGFECEIPKFDVCEEHAKILLAQKHKGLDIAAFEEVKPRKEV